MRAPRREMSGRRTSLLLGGTDAREQRHLLLAHLRKPSRNLSRGPATILSHVADLGGLVPHRDASTDSGVNLAGHLTGVLAEQVDDQRGDVFRLADLGQPGWHVVAHARAGD